MELRELKNNIERIYYYKSKVGFLKGIEKFKSQSNLTLNFNNDLNIVIELKKLKFENSEIEILTGKPLNECLVCRWSFDRITLKRSENIAKYIYRLGIKNYFIKEVERTFSVAIDAVKVIKILNEIELKEKMSDLI